MTKSLETEIQRVFREEADAIAGLASIAPLCAQAVKLIATSSSPLIVTGVGKSGHVASKIASTFCSLGKPAIFVHSAEASHGDMGLIQEFSVVLAISHSGETLELFDLLHFSKKNGNPVIAITGNASSTLADFATIPIVYHIEREACRNGLAPTTSTTTAMAIGDALAIGYTEETQKTEEDFRQYHPGGKLAEKLRTAREVMVPLAAAPTVNKDVAIDELLVTMSEGQLGIGILMDGEDVYGVVSDGDLRRNMTAILDISPKEIATRNPIFADANMNLAEIQKLMRANKISQILITDNGKFVGVVHLLMLSGSFR